MAMKTEQKIKSKHVGCLCCPGNGEKLHMKTKLYMDFGGYLVTKNGELFYMAPQTPNDVPFQDHWEKKVKTLRQIENQAKKDPANDWRVTLELPLRAGEWQRHNDGNWHLISEGPGFA